MPIPEQRTALDKLLILARDAANIGYDNTESGLTADTVQGAIDELAEGGGGGAPVVVYQGQRTMSDSEAIPGESFVIAVEIPVTIAANHSYSLGWMLSVFAGVDASVARFAVRFYLATEEGSWTDTEQLTGYSEDTCEATFGGARMSSGFFPVLGIAKPPGNYFLRCIVEQTTNTTRLDLYDFHPPMIQLTAYPTPAP